MSVIEEKWNYHIDLIGIERANLLNFESNISEQCNQILIQLENSFLKSFNYQVNSGHSYDEEYKLLVEKNKQLRQEIDCKLKDVTKQQTQYENFKQDQKLLSQEIKETHEAFLMAKKYYKKFLKMYFSVESKDNERQIIYIQFFTEAKKDSNNYSVRLSRNVKTKQYELLSTTPKLKLVKEFQRVLQDTNDVPGALYSIRQEFIMVKGLKK